MVVVAYSSDMGKIEGFVNDAVVQEMIRIAIQRMTKQKSYVTKKKILKVLFQTKERLADDNPVKRYLAYYWYRDGPYSEIVDDGIMQLVQKDIVRRLKTSS